MIWTSISNKIALAMLVFAALIGICGGLDPITAKIEAKLNHVMREPVDRLGGQP